MNAVAKVFRTKSQQPPVNAFAGCLAAMVGLAGCGPAAEPASEEATTIVRFLTEPDSFAGPPPLEEDATLVAPGHDEVGRVAVAASLSEFDVSLEGEPEAHHDVVRARLQDGRGQRWHLFAQHNQGVASTVVFLPERERGTPEPLTAYGDAWNSTDPTDRQRLLADGFTESSRYLDPGADALGRSELDQTIAAFQQQLPGALVVPNGDPVASHGDWLIFEWKILVAGVSLMDGFDVVKLSDDDVPLLVAGFFTPLEPSAEP